MRVSANAAQGGVGVAAHTGFFPMARCADADITLGFPGVVVGTNDQVAPAFGMEQFASGEGAVGSAVGG